MGMSKEVYIGAYLKLTVKPITTKETIWQCIEHPQNTGRNYDPTKKFCSLCGSEYTEITKEKVELPSYYDLIEGEDKYEDELVRVNGEDDDDSTILLTGNYGEVGDSIDLEYGDVEIDAQMIGSCQTNFMKKYKDIIEFLEPKVEKLRVKFGVIIYYN